MTDASNLANDVAQDVVDEVDVGSALTGGDVAEDLDGESLGRSIGETVGETVGRLLGRSVVNWVLSKLAFWSDDDDPSLTARFGRSLLVAVGKTFQKPEFKEPIGDALSGFVDSLEARGDSATDAAGDAEEVAEGAAESAGDAADDAAESAEEAADAAAEEAEGAAEKLAAGDMDELRKETYRELLEMMEYSKIQSIAKQSGVKANQQRDDMIDAIVDNFDADSDGSEDAESDEETEDDGSTENDEADDDESS